ncbi:Sodium-coupled monocarboxylate transporter 1 [Araneus ventricosus]|uniref:Sodium-coupled monocarboxylate transporter 1 n=1 Tax=Araneus ventricosus TaxID=182803 RepID=A0A4Y2RGC4_ARAVE|nr:Sodium-coupled monocarboxylate transporter 1 [Araneus ventricosus]
MGVVLYAPALALNAVTGLSTWASILTLAAVCMFYSSQGGLKALLGTVVFQSTLMYLCMIAVIVKISMMIGLTEIVEIADKGGRFNFDEFSGDLTIRYSFWNSLLNGIGFYTYLYGVNQAQVQRYLSLGNLKKAQIALIWSFPLLLLFNLIIFWDGISLYSIFYDCDPMKDENVKLSSADQTRILKRDKCATLPQNAANFNDGTSTSVSVRTVQRTVINMGSQIRRSTRVPLLTAQHEASRLTWARQHYHWTVDDWKHVFWSDESRFQLYRTDAHVRLDNATPHASRVATKWLQEYSSDFRHFHWPPKSPYINIIEDIWDALLHAVEKRSPPPRTPMDLLTALQESWC